MSSQANVSPHCSAIFCIHAISALLTFLYCFLYSYTSYNVTPTAIRNERNMLSRNGILHSAPMMTAAKNTVKK